MSKIRKGTVTTHRIGDWTIEESLKPFPEKENHFISLPDESDVQKWTIDAVCLFVEDVLGKKRYSPLIREHLIDGFALLLLKEEHLRQVFHMPAEDRRKYFSESTNLPGDFICEIFLEEKLAEHKCLL